VNYLACPEGFHGWRRATCRDVREHGNRAGTQAIAMMAIIQFNAGKTFHIQLELKSSVNTANVLTETVLGSTAGRLDLRSHQRQQFL